MTDELAADGRCCFGGQLLYQGADQEGAFQVVERADSGLRALHFSTSATQSLINPQLPQQLQLEYTAVMSLAMSMMASPKRVLLIGLGGGALLQHLFHYFPQLEIHVIERRQAVVDVARDYFSLPTTARISIYIGDAQQQLAQLNGHYDVIFNDAYSRFGPDISLYTDEVYQQFKHLLSEQGVVVNNLWQRRMGENRQLLRYLVRHFPAIAYHQDEQGRNLVLFVASQRWQAPAWQQRCRQLASHCQLPLLEYQQAVRYSIRWLKLRLLLKSGLRWLLAQ